MLTLDQSTLFYWTFSDSNAKKRKHAIDEWAATIPNNAKPASRAPSQTTTRSHKSRSNSALPSLTSGTSRLTAPSVLTNNIKIVTHPALAPVKVKAEPAPDIIEIYSDGGLSDNDEMRGIEREAAVTSPPKGKKRITSEVSRYLAFTAAYLTVFTNIEPCSPKESWRNGIQEKKRRAPGLD